MTVTLQCVGFYCLLNFEHTQNIGKLYTMF